MADKKFYVEVEGTKIPAGFSPENFKSGARYQPLDSDIFICTFPKCGTNWTKRIVQLLIDRESRTGEVADYGLSKCFLEMAGKAWRNHFIGELSEIRISNRSSSGRILPLESVFE